VKAGVASSKDDRAGAIEALRSAAESAEAADMRLHAAVARLRLGELLGGAEGEDLASRASAWFGAQDVRAPRRLAAMLAPGFRSRAS
jgi:hypothetical protein